MTKNPHIGGVVAVIPQGQRLLVIRRSAYIIAPRMYCFPGGHIETDETEQEAVVRELREELAVDVKPHRRIWESVTPWHVSLAWWLCEPINEEPSPNPAEVESFHWLGRTEIAQLPDLLESNHHFLSAWEQGEFSLL